MSNGQVCPFSRRLTDMDARHLLAEGILRTCHLHGPSRVALEVGCDEKTIRRARDGETTLNLAASWNLLDIDPHALDTIAACKGVMFVPILETKPDITTSAGATLHNIGQARFRKTNEATQEADRELIAMEAEADAMLASVLELRSRIVAAKLRRVA